jgi:hypothetical protein
MPNFKIQMSNQWQMTKYQKKFDIWVLDFIWALPACRRQEL